MKNFDYVRPDTIAAAVAAACEPGAAYLAAGTNLLDLMKGGVSRPDRIVDVTHLPGLDRIERLGDGGFRIGAMVRNADLAYDPAFAQAFPMVSEALLSGASAQLRNAATVGGNLLQKTRCSYFYDAASACNRRVPGAGCDALHGENRLHAVLGWSQACIATNPSDFCVPLVALDAIVEIEGKAGRRDLPIEALHRLPGGASRTRDRAGAGRSDRRNPLAPRGRSLLGAWPLSQGSRAHLLCLRDGLGCRSADDRGRQDRPGAAGPWRRCGQALARA